MLHLKFLNRSEYFDAKFPELEITHKNVNCITITETMHSDILEFFVIYESVPVFSFSQQEQIDEVLRAGRISVQALVGREATGEDLVMEVLTDSYIIYYHVQDFLLALRARETLSPLGARRLMKKAARVLENNAKFIKKNASSRKRLRKIEKQLNLVLGETLPSTPQGLLKLGAFVEDLFTKYPPVDAITLVTAEAWPVYVMLRNPQSPPRYHENSWRNAVDTLYESIQSESPLVLRFEDKSLFVIHRIEFPAQEDDWWALIIQVTIPENSNWQSQHLVEVWEVIISSFIPVADKVITEMVQNARRYWGMEGILSEPINLLRLEQDEIPCLIRIQKKRRKKRGVAALETKETIGKPLFFSIRGEKNVGEISLRDLPQKILDGLLHKLPLLKTKQNEYFTLELDVDEGATNYLFNTMEWLAEQLSKKSQIEVYIGIDGMEKPEIFIPRLSQLSEKGVFSHLFSWDIDFIKRAIDEGIHGIVLSPLSGIQDFVFYIVSPESEKLGGVALVLYQVPGGNKHGIISIDEDLVKLIKAKLEDIETVTL